jgi:ankyrin repeat protein
MWFYCLRTGPKECDIVKLLTSIMVTVLMVTGLIVPPTQADEIHNAADQGDKDRVAALIAADPSLATVADNRQCRPIHFAANGGHVSILAQLHDAGAALDVRDVDGDTPLHWAAVAGHLDAIKWLLEQDVDIDARNHHQDTPLLYATKRHQFEAVKLLVNKGADLEAANDYGRTPLLWTVREGGNLEMARLLLRLGADVNAHDRFGDTSLSLAAWRGFKTLVNILLDNGAVVETQGEMGQNLLSEAAGRGITRLYRQLAAAGIEIPTGNGEQGGYLHMAAAGGSRGIVADLIKRGCDPQAADVYGWTPLHYAAARNRPAAAAELLIHTADPNQRTLSGYSALNLAEEKNANEAAGQLRSKQVDPSPRVYPELTTAYLGQHAPGPAPQLFAPDIVANPFGQHGNVTFSADGDYTFWSGYIDIPDSGYWYGTILYSQRVKGRWTAPRMAPFAAERQGDDVPFFSSDGKRLFFMSRRPLTTDQEGRKENIWVIEREGDGWGEPQPLPPVINRFEHHWQFSVAANGNLYFASRQGSAETGGIYCSPYAGGQYTEPEFLRFGGSTPFIAPDESYLITLEFTPEGRCNLIRYRQSDGSWGEPVNITTTTKSGIGGLCPMVSPDGRQFFFVSGRNGNNNSWYVDAGFIEELRR